MLRIGLAATVRLEVAESDTAVALRSGDVPVLGTPRVLALLEEATVAAVAGALPAGSTSVGTRVELAHLAATCPGRTVVAEAELVRIDGPTLTFRGRVLDGQRTAAEGEITRVVVQRERFLARRS